MGQFPSFPPGLNNFGQQPQGFGSPGAHRGGFAGQPQLEGQFGFDEGFRGPGRSEQKEKEESPKLATIISIRCQGVPFEINKASILEKHFAKFGEVVNVLPNLKKKTALVHFSDHKAAKMAKNFGQSVSSEQVIKKINYGLAKIALQTAAEERSTPAEPETKITITQGATELLRIMKQQTHSDDDRWKVLDARDKYMRIKYPKKQLRSGLEIEDMNLIGTCPDICPEKERYRRSAKNQLWWYEKEKGKLNHLSAVKEHSRSAADQDVPLPHELRPPSVLNKTMNFLLSNIMNRVDNMTGTMDDWFTFSSHPQTKIPWSKYNKADGESNDETVGNWYGFLWSATRGIRKDITQH